MCGECAATAERCYEFIFYSYEREGGECAQPAMALQFIYSEYSLLFSGTNAELNYIREHIAANAAAAVMAHNREMLS